MKSRLKGQLRAVPLGADSARICRSARTLYQARTEEYRLFMVKERSPLAAKALAHGTVGVKNSSTVFAQHILFMRLGRGGQPSSANRCGGVSGKGSRARPP